MSLIDSLPVVHLGDVGTIFRITVVEKTYNAATDCWDDTVVDISSASRMEILFLLPSGKTRGRPAAFTTDGTDGLIQYTTVDGDIDEAGGKAKPWTFSGWVLRPSGQHTTLSHQFRVEAGIPRPAVITAPTSAPANTGTGTVSITIA
jgi:hypothetical protein